MADDIVARLRTGQSFMWSGKNELNHAAADEIERLRAALREISRAGGDLPAEVLLKACIDAARAALAPAQEASDDAAP
jgi:hypothetical protein